MRSDRIEKLVFGSPNPDVKYRLRLAAYAVIAGRSGKVAVVKGDHGYFLPGGGSFSGETPEQTLRREVKEELDCEVRILRQIGEVIQYFYAQGQLYRMEAVFFEAEFASEPTGAGEHELYWLESEEADGPFYHQCHAWAVSQL